jgi:hypothetical protein
MTFFLECISRSVWFWSVQHNLLAKVSDKPSMSDEFKSSESEGGVWASYSDLFTNVAIIFLVMFVFTLIYATQ